MPITDDAGLTTRDSSGRSTPRRSRSSAVRRLRERPLTTFRRIFNDRDTG